MIVLLTNFRNDNEHVTHFTLESVFHNEDNLNMHKLKYLHLHETKWFAIYSCTINMIGSLLLTHKSKRKKENICPC